MADGELMLCGGEEERVVLGSCTTGEHTTGIGVLVEEGRGAVSGVPLGAWEVLVCD